MGLINKNHVYSYSQLSSFDECPFSFYLERIDKNCERLSNAFAERGTLIHDIINSWARGLITKEKMPDEYKRRYPDEVVNSFPKVLASKGYTEKAYKIGLEYMENFDEFEGYEIIASEDEFRIELELSDNTTRSFVGIIDMVLRDKETGELIICDHKSKSLTSFKRAENEMYRQQLLYAPYVKEKYGEYPSLLMFNLFNENGIKATRPFTMEAYNEAIQWATDCILKIEEYDILEWLSSKEEPDFFCENLCSVRQDCPISKKPKAKKGKNKI